MAFERTVRDIMSQPVLVTRKDATVTSVIPLLLRWHISGLPVVDDDGKLLGIVTEHDIMNSLLSGNAADTRVGEVMIAGVETRSPDTPVEEVMNLFATRCFRRVPVLEDGRVVGVVSRRDVVRELNRTYERLVESDGMRTAGAVPFRSPLDSPAFGDLMSTAA